MNENANRSEPREGGRPGTERESYEPPRVTSEQAFETLALTCGKTDTEFVCVGPGGGGKS